MYSDPTVKPWSSRSWTPPGYSSRTVKDETPKGHVSDEGEAEKREVATNGSDQAKVEYRV